VYVSKRLVIIAGDLESKLIMNLDISSNYLIFNDLLSFLGFFYGLVSEYQAA